LYTETVQLALGGFTFLSTGPRTPVSPRWLAKKRKRALAWKVHAQRPFVFRGYSVLGLVRSASYEGFKGIWFADTPMKIMKCVGSDVGLVWDA
jgi:hypothetical protein